MKKGRLVSVALSCIVAAGLFAVPTNAKNAQAGAAPDVYYVEGVTSSEIILLSGATKVEVEQEKLTFHAEQPPLTYSIENYHDTVRAEYTLYNPSDSDETLRLALPFGRAECYYQFGEDLLQNAYRVTLNGENVETRLRHSFIANDYPTAENLMGTSEVFHADTPVHGYAYSVTLPSGYTVEHAYSFALELELHYDPDKTIIFSPEVYSCSTENGNMRVELYLSGNLSRNLLYVAGEEAEFISARVVKRNEQVAIEGAEISRIPTDVSTFADFAGVSHYEGVENEDWLRCYGNYLELNRPYAHEPDYVELYRFAEYEITVPAGGRVTHAVETPLIPNVRGSVCYYAYSFDAARAWASYGTLDVEIYAGSAPKDCTLNLLAGEGVYTHGRSNLPMGDLRFDLGEYEWDGGADNGLDDLGVAFIILAVLAVVAAGVVVIVVRVRRKRLKMLGMRVQNNIEESDGEEKK